MANLSDDPVSQSSSVTMIVDALQEKFGADAAEVARVQARQAELSSGETAKTWAAVLVELERRVSPRAGA